MTASAPVSIRVATPDDASVIVDLIHALATYEHLERHVTVTPQAIRDALAGPHPLVEALLAEVDGRPVGYALFFHTFSTFLGEKALYLEDLFVTPDRRSQGVGRALLGRVAHLARARGCGRIEWAVLDWNTPALAFYRGLGAEPVEGWTIYRLAGRTLMQAADLARPDA